MFDYALTCGLIQANPVMALPMRHVYRAAARDRALTPDEIRQFLRAMQADGRSETYAFTETDASLGTGFALKGAAWGRAADTLGVGYLRNSLSKDRRDYLAAGGISFFIGDGRINYHPEQVFETYYSANVAKNVFVSADYQRMWNPAYNADRGPANFYGMRIHAEF